MSSKKRETPAEDSALEIQQRRDGSVHLASTKSAEKTGGKMSGDSIVGIGAVLEPSPSGNLQVSTDPDGIPVSERAANRGS